MINTRKYKDQLPQDTIYQIRDALKDLGILTVEQWIDSVEGIHSLRVSIEGSGIGTNGKGTTQAYALASAYGEFMERLQNNILYNVMELSPDTLNYGGFYYSPDEEYMDIEKLLHSKEYNIHPLIPKRKSTDNSAVELLQHKFNQWYPEKAEKANRDLLEHYAALFKTDELPGGFITIPFYDVNQQKVCYVPTTMLRIHYGSNGMSAGNTREEALVQALSEILERYAERELIFNRLTPPTVPEEYLQQFPHLHQLIKHLEQEGNLQIIVKDYSLGQGLPVVGIVIIDREAQKYYMRSGAHPSFEIALERCLTETLQGKLLNDTLHEFMTEYSSEDSVSNQPANYRSIVATGKGVYPGEIFSPQESYPFSEFRDVDYMTNKDMLHYLTELILSKGYDILVRDVSFLDFPSVHVVIPGMSDIFYADKQTLELFRYRKETQISIRNLSQASDEELNMLVRFIINRQKFVLEADNITRILGFPVKETFPWHKVFNQQFISAALYRQGRVEEAWKVMCSFIDYVLKQNRLIKMSNRDFTYNKCVRDFLYSQMNGLDGAEIKGRLKMIYPTDIVDKVFQIWGQPESVFKEYGKVPCWNCSDCDIRQHCFHEPISNLHKLLKKRYAENYIDQNQLREVFSNPS